MKAQIIKLLKENIRANLWVRQWFLRYDTKNTATKDKLDNLDFTQIKNMCAANDTIKKVKAKPQTEENIF